MSFFGHWYVIVILLLALAVVIFGPRSFPRWGQLMGSAYGGFRGWLSRLRGESPGQEAKPPA